MNVCSGHFDILKEAKVVCRHCFIGRNIVCNCGEGSYNYLWPRMAKMEKKRNGSGGHFVFQKEGKISARHLFIDLNIVCKIGEEIFGDG